MVPYTPRAGAARATRPGGLLTPVKGGKVRREIDMTSIDGVARFTTVACAWARPVPDGLSVRTACAGQPDPLILRTNADVERVAPGGPPCGAFPDITYPDQETVLRRGEALVFYIDGVLDAGAPRRQVTVTDVASTLSARRPASAEEVADTLTEVVAEHGGEEPRDDVAVLVLAA